MAELSEEDLRNMYLASISPLRRMSYRVTCGCSTCEDVRRDFEIWKSKRGSKEVLDSKIPRRCRIVPYTSVEIAIREAIRVVEEVGCHPLLTEAVSLLSDAKDRVADFAELPEQKMPLPTQEQIASNEFDAISLTLLMV